MSGHTKEPWRVTDEGYIASNGFVPIRTPFREDAFNPGPGRSDHSDELLDANARRIVACVNACEGIDTDLIEQRMLGDQIAAKMAVIDKCDRLNTENAALNDYCATVEQQRDQLLSAATAFSNYVHGEECATDGPVRFEYAAVMQHVYRIRDAIAAAEVKP